MPTVTELLIRLVVSLFELMISIGRLAIRDPFNAVLVLVGGAILAASSASFGYLVVGALADEIGIEIPTLDEGPRDASGRIPTERPNPNYESEAAGGAARAKREE